MESGKFTQHTEQPEKDLEKINEFIDNKLKNEKLIAFPQKHDCEIVVAVPVYNEDTRRIFEQIKSLLTQTYAPDKYEVIYVINNDNPEKENGDEYKKIIANNKKILDMPIWKNKNNDNLASFSLEEQGLIKQAQKLNLFVIDKSTAGNEIKDCNVGKARNRVLAESAQRFLKNNKNGIIFHTDADSIFDNQKHLEIVAKTFEENRDTIAIAGGVKYKLNLDNTLNKKTVEIEKHLRKAEILKRIKIITNYLNNSLEKFIDSKKRFSGPHMIARAYESALIGGFDDANRAEDVNFGNSLENYATKNGKRIIGMRESLVISTSLRESTRTESSFGHFLKEDFSYKETPVDYPFPHISKNEFEEKIISYVKNGEIKNHEKLKDLFTDKDNKLLIKNSALVEIENILQNNDIKNARNPLIAKWLMDNIGVIEDWISVLYKKKYPKIVANKDLYNKLAIEISKNPNGLELIKNLDASFGQIEQ